MVDWVSGLPDASAAERLAAFLLLRLNDGSAKECPTTDFLQKDTLGNAALVGSAPDNGVYRAQSFGTYFQFGQQQGGTSQGFAGWNVAGGASVNTYRYRTTGDLASLFEMSSDGSWRFANALAGTADNAIAFNNRFRIDGAGRAILGDDAVSSSTLTVSFSTTGTERGAISMNGGTGVLDIKAGFAGYGGQITFTANGAERLRIDGSGHQAPGADNAQTNGTAARRWSVVFAGTATISTSDARYKREIGEIPDAWLDAWTDVQWQRFKFVDGSRWHIGLIAQDVHAAFAAHGLDAFEIGLCCFDQWEERREPVLDDDGNPTGKERIAQAAGDRWGLRYDECQAIEAAWQRRRIAQLEARIAAMEAGQ